MDTSIAPLNSAIAVLNQDHTVLRDTLRRVKGRNFMTPYFMGVFILFYVVNQKLD